jgi:hypothetical protein
MYNQKQLYFFSGNASGAVYHYKQVLRMDPNHASALELIQVKIAK